MEARSPDLRIRHTTSQASKRALAGRMADEEQKSRILTVKRPPKNISNDVRIASRGLQSEKSIRDPKE